MSTKYSLEMNGRLYRLINKYVIPPGLQDDYCNSDITINGPEGRQTFYHTGICPLCDRKYEEAFNDQPKICPSLEINKRYDHVIRICSDCFFYIRWEEGDESIPYPAAAVIQAGFVPKRL